MYLKFVVDKQKSNIFNKPFFRIGEKDRRMFVIECEQHEVEDWLNLVKFFFAGTNTLIILDDCAASKDVKRRTCAVANRGFSGRHIGISVWVVTQKITSSFRQNTDVIVHFCIPSAKTRQETFDEHGGYLSPDELQYSCNGRRGYRVSRIHKPTGIRAVEWVRRWRGSSLNRPRT